MLTRIRSLGSIFFAFIGGGVIGTSTNIVSSVFLGDDLPRAWPVLLVSCGLLLAGSVVFCNLAVALSELEVALAAVPRSLGRREQESARNELTRNWRRRAHLLLAVSLFLTMGGVLALPLRLYLVTRHGWR
ncbi:hypothetical protein V1634_02510 [Plantactinospora veratri]|uniref:Uncharacterized protein n=1 Tax=Plantactinospora veratri TaxID=1436122 RepID=A0ABU7S6X9_9ACTN